METNHLQNSYISVSQKTHPQTSPNKKSTSKAQDRTNLNTQKLYKDYLDDILYKFTYYKNLNPIDILHLVPDNWVLASPSTSSSNDTISEENTALFEFLTQAISETMSTQR